jgi:hypothetical protein
MWRYDWRLGWIYIGRYWIWYDDKWWKRDEWRQIPATVAVDLDAMSKSRVRCGAIFALSAKGQRLTGRGLCAQVTEGRHRVMMTCQCGQSDRDNSRLCQELMLDKV